MSTRKELVAELDRLLKLRTLPIAFKRFEKASELDKLPRVRRLDRFFTFCQATTVARLAGWTIGIKAEDFIYSRCARIHGLAARTEATMEQESTDLSRSWFASKEDAAKHLRSYPLVPVGEAVALAPVAAEKFEPDVILIYGNPAQLSLLMNGLQWKDYERFQFYFTGEGSCVDDIAQCYLTHKPSLSIPCYGERRFGHVTEDELALALPPDMLEKGIEGLQKLYAVGLRYPTPPYGAECDSLSGMVGAAPWLAEEKKRRESQKK